MSIAILYSGGLDSLVMRAAAGSSGVCVWVDLGQPYAEREWSAAQRTAPEVVRINCQMMAHPAYVGMSGHIVPARNLLLATIAAGFGDKVWLGALLGETHPFGNRDKSVEWRHLTSGVLTYNFLPVRPETTVEYPLGHMTKREVVAYGLSLGLTPNDFAQTTSCHSDIGDDLPCGVCVACFHRWIGMSLNGIYEMHQQLPWTSNLVESEMRAMVAAETVGETIHYHPSRIRDTREALESVGIPWG